MIFQNVVHECDFCVVGGGLAGMCAALAAARGGSKVVIMQDRPMFGGNASSEIRMWVSGADNSENLESGIIEEIQLESLYKNPDKIYAVWDGILYGKIREEKNITPILNCSCLDAVVENGKITEIKGWQTTTQKYHTVKAKYFADCSGDSVLAPLTGAEYMVGREANDEYGEKTSQKVADLKTMGMSCLIQCRKTDRKSEFIAPDWAVKMTPEVIKLRKPTMSATGENFWYLELGGNRDSIADTEEIRDDLIALAYGMFDYIKNSGEVPDADYWQLDFLGFLPGKRESRRMKGDYVMTQTDVLAGGHFDDIIAYGGWPLDDHHPDGFYHAGHPNVWGPTPSPYGIPYRCIYSKNIDNLFFAGRNISLTHAAISSSRVMCTCATLGEAAGTAANIARIYGLSPRGVYEEKIGELKAELMRNGAFLPYNSRVIPDFIMEASMTHDAENLRNGKDRTNHTYGDGDMGAVVPVGEKVGYEFKAPARVRNIHMAFDSDFGRTTLNIDDFVERCRTMRANIRPDSPTMSVPSTLVKAYTITGVTESGETVVLKDEKLNILQCTNVKTDIVLKALYITVNEIWNNPGAKDVHILSFDAE